MDKREQARALYAEGKSLKDIAEELGAKEATVRKWKQRDDWDKKCHMTQSVSRAYAASRQRRATANRKAAESVEANDELNDQEKDFCIAFVHAPNASQAAMKTGRYGSYGAARFAAWKMMQNPAVQVEIKRLKRMKRMTMLADGDDVVEMHMRIAFADMSQFVEFGRETVPVMGAFGPVEVKDPDTGEKVTLVKEVNTVRFKEHTDVDGTLIAEVKQGKDGTSVKLEDRQKSLAFLERFFELNPMDRHKRDYDNAKLELERKKQEVGNEDALEKLDSMLEGIEKVMRDRD